jgi:hypothetical protein
MKRVLSLLLTASLAVSTTMISRTQAIDIDLVSFLLWLQRCRLDAHLFVVVVGCFCSSRLALFMFSFFQCEPYIVMYTDNAQNDCFGGDSAELAFNLALPTLSGWAKAATGEVIGIIPPANNGPTSTNATAPTSPPTNPTVDMDIVEPTLDDAVDFIGFAQVVAHKTGYKAGYSQALNVGFDDGYQSEITLTNVGGSEAPALSDVALLPSYKSGFDSGWKEGYDVGYYHGAYKGRHGDWTAYFHGYDDGQAGVQRTPSPSPSPSSGGGTRRKMFEIDDEQRSNLLDSTRAQLRGSQQQHEQEQKERKAQTRAECKHMCFHSLKSKRLQCEVYGCFQKFPGLTARRRRRQLQEGEQGEVEEEVLMSNNNVLQTIITADGIDGGLDFRNLISDLLQQKCNIHEVDFEVWFMCLDPEATQALQEEEQQAQNNNTAI